MTQLHTPQEAAQWLRARVTGTLCADSRQLQQGDAFIAWPGAAVDARRFVAAALEQGAGACLVEQEGVQAWDLGGERVGFYTGLKAATGPIAAEFFANPSEQLDVIAVTGTNGKTSTAWWLAQALSALPAAHRKECGVIGTLGVGRASAAEVTATGLTTADPVCLQRTLRQFADARLKACAIEASSIGLEERRLDGTSIRVAVFTNFTQDHLDYHGNMDAYWQAKRQLFDWKGLRAAVINVDDAKGEELAQELAATALDVWTVSCKEHARLQARNIAYSERGMQFDVVEGAVIVPVQTRMIGSYNVLNMLGVLAAMRSVGIGLQEAVQACAALQAVPGRMECVGGVNEPLVVVDYAHTPDALGQVLSALRPMAEQRAGQLWCVFGCGGDRDASKRPLMGAIAAQKADRVVVTSDNPRSEKPETILSQILLGLPHQRSVEVQADRAQAIAHTILHAAPADVVLLAGKGHENTQDILGVKHPFSDLTHATDALRQRALAVAEGAA